jgi:hypothetical protein
MATSMMSEASRLHGSRVSMRMRSITVGLLAMLGLSACGVGVDDPEGQQAVGTTQQAVYIAPDGTVLSYQGQTTATPTSPGNGGQNELPQDPVPVHPNVHVIMLGQPAMK